MSVNAEQQRHKFPISRVLAGAVACLLVLIFVLPLLSMGYVGIVSAINSIRNGPTNDDLSLIPIPWQNNRGVRRYLNDNDVMFDLRFPDMGASGSLAQPGEGETFAAVGTLRGISKEEVAAKIVADWFQLAPASIVDETIAWMKRYRDRAWKSLLLPVNDRRRIFWRQLAIGALQRKPDEQLVLLVSGLTSGNAVSEADWQAAETIPTK